MRRRGGIDLRGAVAILVIVVAGLLVFWNLGHYALWDDEANTALLGEAVWRHGDTGVLLGHNVYAYRHGAELTGLVSRYSPPLPYYVEAPFVGLLGRSAFAARLPFALLALLGLLLVLYWLWKDRAPLRTWILVGLGVCGNVSLILYSRQARYYALAVLLTLLVTYLYLHRDGRRTLFGLNVGLAALLATHYIPYVGLVAALGLDYLLFARYRRPVARRDLLILVASQVAIGAAVFSIWNPLATPGSSYRPASLVVEKLTLLWWHVRDLNAAEFGAVLLLFAGPLLPPKVRRSNRWLVRLPLGIVVYVLAVVLVSPQPVGTTVAADIRYAVAIIPGLIYLGVITLGSLLPGRGWLCYVAALLLFGTNLAQVATAWIVGGQVGPPRSTLAAFVGELQRPRPDPFGAAADWINANVEPGASVLTFPDYTMYPLMFHAPRAVYAWQLDQSRRAEYAMLADIHFHGLLLPDYVVAFGEGMREARYVVDAAVRRGARYVEAAHLAVHWPDESRPELYFHSFEAKPFGDPASDGVRIFRREGPGDGAVRPDAGPGVAVYDVELGQPSAAGEPYRLGGVLYPDDYSGSAVVEFTLRDPSTAETSRWTIEVELSAGIPRYVATRINVPRRPWMLEIAAWRSPR